MSKHHCSKKKNRKIGDKALSVTQYLSPLDRYFASVPITDAPEQVQALLQPLLNSQSVIERQGIQVTFFGVFKAGKSTLLNAIIGAELLPSRVNRATGVVTKMFYASQASASVIWQASDSTLLEKTIFFDDLAEYILLDLSGGSSKAPKGIKEVSINLPLPLMYNCCILTDTPGSMDNEALNERSYQEIKKSDLAVMVLRADKLLSEDEKDTAKSVHELLNGNIVFFVNRLGFVDEEEHEEVLDWAKTALKGLGNPLVGQPCIFATDAKEALEAKINDGNRHSAYFSGLMEFEGWLERLLSTPVGEKVALLSRLRVLSCHLLQAHVWFQNQLTKAQATAEQLRQEEEEALQQEQFRLRRQIAEDRMRLSGLKSDLDELGKSFVDNCIGQTRALINSDSEWSEKLKSCFNSARSSYHDKVSNRVKAAVQSKMYLPTFSLSSSSSDVSISAAENSGWATIIGGAIGVAAGGPLGAVIGGLIVGWLFGTDIEEKTLELVTETANELRPVITVEAEEYIDRVERLLVDFEESHQYSFQPSSSLRAAQQTERYYSELLSWCEDFENAINDIKNEVIE